jgi:CDP-diacylglycerol--serine O-phosphatidyltransferase
MRLPRFPDLLTTANLACGVASILLASQGQLTLACGLVFAAAVFDVFDGLAARAMGGGTPLGAQLDSLADMVSFGVAPGIIAFHLTQVSVESVPMLPWVLTGWISVASAWRLAKFNIDTRQSHGFLGLPTPANALFWASMGLWGFGDHFEAMRHPRMLFVIGILLGVLMLSELPLPGLKFKHFRWQGNQVIYLLAGLGVVLVVLYGILAVPLILLVYVLSPLWGKAFPKEA